MHDIYDRIFKKILTLSSTAITNLINGLFGTNYPSDSSIRYNWTEFEDDGLKKTLADTIITINDVYSYHLEAQMSEDEDIMFRVFEYGYRYAERNRDGETLYFPEPKIVYLYTSSPVPDKYTLRLNFGTQGTFNYTITTFKYLETSIDELNRRKLIALIPFELLKLRDRLSRSQTAEDIEALKKLLSDDIIRSIEINVECGNITQRDGRSLKSLTSMLFRHIYEKQVDISEVDELDESIIFEADILEKKIDELSKKYEKLILECNSAIEERDSVAKERDSVAKERDEALQESEAIKAENARLKAEIEKLKSKQ